MCRIVIGTLCAVLGAARIVHATQITDVQWLEEGFILGANMVTGQGEQVFVESGADE
jgi:hypothetical protein